jgi:Rha family phage regulatory protein
MTGSLPALCAELKLRGEGRVVIVNSRDVAEWFEKRHDHVLRDIDEARQKIAPDLGTSWFRPVTVLDAYNREQPSFDLTRQGFTLLVMGWTGERAMAIKVRYIEAFDAMELALNEQQPVTGSELIQAVRELVAPLGVRFDGQDQAIERVETKVEAISRDVEFVKNHIIKGRKNLLSATKTEHIQAVEMMGGRCPCCGRAEIVTNGKKSPFAEYDHFYENSRADIDHTWLICKPCHADLTTGRVLRRDREPEFRAYQAKRQRLRPQRAFLF